MSIDQLTSTTAGLLLASGFVLSYLIKCWLKGEKTKLDKAANIAISSVGIMAGFRVCYFAIANPAHQFGETDRLYLFVGALAVGWLSIEQVIKILNSKDS